jgi:hypothetical protein
MGCSLLLTCLFCVWQGSGGGVYIHTQGGTITLDNCNIHNNQAPVRARLHETTPSPRWGARFTDVLCLAPLCVRREYADATEHTTLPDPIAPMECSLPNVLRKRLSPTQPTLMPSLKTVDD